MRWGRFPKLLSSATMAIHLFLISCQTAAGDGGVVFILIDKKKGRSGVCNI